MAQEKIRKDTSRIKDKGRLMQEQTRNPGFQGEARAYRATVSPTAGVGDYQDIQEAINYVGENFDNGIIYLLDGTYTISNEIDVDYDGISIIGQTTSGVVLQVADSTDIGVLFDVNSSRFSIENLTIDGNKASNIAEQTLLEYKGSYSYLVIRNVLFKNQSGSDGICVDSNAEELTLIENSKFLECEGYAIVDGTTDSCIYSNILVDNCKSGFSVGVNALLIGCNVKNCSSYGIYLSYSRGKAIGCNVESSNGGVSIAESNCSVIGCSLKDNTYEGIASSYECIVSNNRISGNGGSGIRIYGGGGDSESVISSNHIESNDQHGIYLDGGADCVISDNYITYKGDTDNTYSGIYLAEYSGAATVNSSRNVITGNRIAGPDGLNDFKYGIREDDSSQDYNLIDGNIVDGGSTAQISTQGANTVTVDNITS